MTIAETSQETLPTTKPFDSGYVHISHFAPCDSIELDCMPFLRAPNPIFSTTSHPIPLHHTLTLTTTPQPFATHTDP